MPPAVRARASRASLTSSHAPVGIAPRPTTTAAKRRRRRRGVPRGRDPSRRMSDSRWPRAPVTPQRHPPSTASPSQARGSHIRPRPPSRGRAVPAAPGCKRNRPPAAESPARVRGIEGRQVVTLNRLSSLISVRLAMSVLLEGGFPFVAFEAAGKDPRRLVLGPSLVHPRGRPVSGTASVNTRACSGEIYPPSSSGAAFQAAAVMCSGTLGPLEGLIVMNNIISIIIIHVLYY